jgi:hypothetical protein
VAVSDSLFYNPGTGATQCTLVNQELTPSQVYSPADFFNRLGSAATWRSMTHRQQLPSQKSTGWSLNPAKDLASNPTNDPAKSVLPATAKEKPRRISD